MSSSPTERRRRSGRPLWLVEGLDIVEERRGPLLGAVALVVVIPLLLAIFAPSIVPPTPLVGAAVAVAALLLGLAAALAVDTTDLIVRGPRHVGAAGGELVALLPNEANPGSVRSLALSVLEAREPGAQLLLGIAGAGREAAQTAGWTDALGLALVRSGVSVLRIDLASGRSETPGLAEVIQGEHRLADVVEIEPGRRLARLGTGRDPIRALRSLPSLPGRLPADLDVLLVALPSATNREVVNASRALDHVLVMAHRDSTSRVQLIAALDALGATGATAQVVLVDDRTLSRLGPELPQRTRRSRELDPDPSDADDELASADAPDASDAPPSPDVPDEPQDADDPGSSAEDAPVASAGPAPVAEPVEAAGPEGMAAESEDVAAEPVARDAPEDGSADAPPRAAGITGIGGGAVVAAELAGRMREHRADLTSDPEEDSGREAPEDHGTAEDHAATEDSAPTEHVQASETALGAAEEHGAAQELAQEPEPAAEQEPEAEPEPEPAAEPEPEPVAESGPVAGSDLEAADEPSAGSDDAGLATEDDPWAHFPPPQLPDDAPAVASSDAAAEPGSAATPAAPVPGPFGDWVSRQAARDDAARKAAREQAAREDAAREEAAREEAAREEAAREQAAREDAAREDAAREDAAREEAAREEAAGEQAAGHDSDEPMPASEPRDVDILIGAAEASALAIAESRSDDDLDPPAGEAQTADERTASDPVPASMAPPAADLVPRTHTSVESDGDDTSADDEDSTDELPAVRRPEPIRPAESEQDDLLRTTAQLAVLMDDLDVRTDDQP